MLILGSRRVYEIRDVISGGVPWAANPAAWQAPSPLVVTTMRPFVQQLVRAVCHTRYNNPHPIPAAAVRHLTATRPTYKSSTPRSQRPQAAGGVSDDDHDHSADSYLKEVDSSPPADPSTYQVDDSSDKVQRPHHPPSGAYSRAGVGSEEYRAVDKQAAPLDPPSGSRGGTGAEAGKKLRYSGKGSLEKGGKTSDPGEGPEGASATGRKPEGKQ